jgi:hypothetical protein
MTATQLARRGVAALAIIVLLGACGDDDDSSSTTTTAPADDVCADSQALSASVDDLKDVDLATEGTNGATTAISAVKDDLAAFSESAGDEVKPQVQAVEDAIGELEAAVEDLDTKPAGTALQAVSDVASSASALIATLDDGACG